MLPFVSPAWLGCDQAGFLVWCELMTQKRTFRALSGPHMDKHYSLCFMSLPKSLSSKPQVFRNPWGYVFTANRTDVPFSLLTSSLCFLRFLVPSLHVLPVSCDSSYPSLYRPEPFPHFKCTVLSGVHFLPQIPRGNCS